MPVKSRDDLANKIRFLEEKGAPESDIREFAKRGLAEIEQVQFQGVQPSVSFNPESFVGQRDIEEKQEQLKNDIFGEKPSFSSLLPAIGATALTIAAPEFGIPSKVGLSILGGSGGKAFEQIARRAQNKPVPQTSLESLKQIGEAGLTMGGAELAGGVIGKAASFPFARSTVQDIIQGAERLPIAKPEIAVGKDLVEKVQSGIQKSSLGEKLLKEENIKEQTKLASESAFKDKFFEEASKFKQGGIEGLGRKEIGERIKDTFDRVIKGKSFVERRLYKEIPSEIKISNKSDAFEYIKNLFKREGIQTAFEKELPEDVLKGIEEQLGRKPSEIQLAKTRDKFTEKLQTGLNVLEPRDFNFMNNILKDLENSNLTFGDLKRIRTLTGEMANFDSVKAAGLEKVYNGLYGKLTNDLRRTAEEGGFSKQFEKANSFSSDFFKFSRSDVAKAINTKNPENLIDFIVGENTPSRIETVLNNFSEKGKTELRGLAFERINEAGGGNLNGLSKALNSYSDETIDTLFGKGSESIKSLRKLGETLSEEKKPQIGLERPISIVSEAEKDSLKIVNSSTGKKFLDSFKSSNDPEVYSIIINNLDKETKEAIKSSVFSDILENSRVGVGSQSVKINAKLLNDQLDKLSENSIKSIYEKDSKYVLALKDISKLSNETLKGGFLEDLNRIRLFHPAGWLLNLKRFYETASLPKEVFKVLEKREVPVSELSKKKFLLGLPEVQRGGTLATQIGISRFLNQNENEDQ